MTTSTVLKHSAFADHFSAKVRRDLLSKGVAIIGITALPDANGSFLNSSTGYQLNDNGTHRILMYLEVEKLSAAPVLIDRIEYTSDSGQPIKIELLNAGKSKGGYLVHLFMGGQRHGFNFATIELANAKVRNIQRGN